MIHPQRKIGYSGLLLVILLSAIIGQKVHIYSESPLHFAALCGDLLPDNGARSAVAEKCFVDDYFFFPCICTDDPVLEAHLMRIGSPAELPTSPKLAGSVALHQLRAPPATV